MAAVVLTQLCLWFHMTGDANAAVWVCAVLHQAVAHHLQSHSKVGRQSEYAQIKIYRL